MEVGLGQKVGLCADAAGAGDISDYLVLITVGLKQDWRPCRISFRFVVSSGFNSITLITSSLMTS
ncbi:hypothetical protein R1sor_000786 [Riccia sorocarpa]|uniref:Uncharacterized protein n=1 Tax=Riccia sorocarpa TaxID=122646 RepID=A0ABD3GY28_9MARC